VFVQVWATEVTWRRVAELREHLFDAIDSHAEGLLLDVGRVSEMDRTGIALLIGANIRANSLGRPLTLLDDSGYVTAALTRAHVLGDFRLTRDPAVPHPRSATDDERAALAEEVPPTLS
jgi:anti-anti-sigma regulatory factor